jgi:hypothetical protein
LIERLAKSVETTAKTKNDSWKSLYGSITLDIATEKFIADLKKERHFRDKSIGL